MLIVIETNYKNRYTTLTSKQIIQKHTLQLTLEHMLNNDTCDEINKKGPRVRLRNCNLHNLFMLEPYHIGVFREPGVVAANSRRSRHRQCDKALMIH